MLATSAVPSPATHFKQVGVADSRSFIPRLCIHLLDHRQNVPLFAGHVGDDMEKLEEFCTPFVAKGPERLRQIANLVAYSQDHRPEWVAVIVDCYRKALPRMQARLSPEQWELFITKVDQYGLRELLLEASDLYGPPAPKAGPAGVEFTPV